MKTLRVPNLAPLLLAGLILLVPGVDARALFNSSSGNSSMKGETEKSIAKKIVKGKTTKAQVKAQFGAPLTTYFTDGGKEVWIYHYTQQRDNVTNYVPLVNRVKQGSKGTRKELQILFDDSGKVGKYTMGESKVETKWGLFK